MRTLLLATTLLMTALAFAPQASASCTSVYAAQTQGNAGTYVANEAYLVNLQVSDTTTFARETSANEYAYERATLTNGLAYPGWIVVYGPFAGTDRFVVAQLAATGVFTSAQTGDTTTFVWETYGNAWAIPWGTAFSTLFFGLNQTAYTLQYYECAFATAPTNPVAVLA